MPRSSRGDQELEQFRRLDTNRVDIINRLFADYALNDIAEDMGVTVTTLRTWMKVRKIKRRK